MRELDQLLGWYLDERYAAADDAGRCAFAELLEQPDPELWDWLSIGAPVPNAAWKQVIDEIRSRNRL